jgi:hypothetical protein
MASTYILIDTTLIGYPADKPWTRKRRKLSWVAVLYEREAIAVSPILIDIERALVCDRLDVVMDLVNAQRPQLGVSFIETDLSLAELHSHLREFIYVKTENGIELTLRFADCAVLPSLFVTMTAEQWSSIVGPFKRWQIHGRDGKLMSLSVSKKDAEYRHPLILRNDQIAALENAMRTDQLLSNLRKMRPGRPSEYLSLTAYEQANHALQKWLSAGHKEDTDLLLFARDVFDTDGLLLKHVALDEVLAQQDPAQCRKQLHRIAMPHLSGS